MLSKNTIKIIKSLQIKKFRDELGLFIIEGRKSVMELLDSDFEITHIFSTEIYKDELKSNARAKQCLEIVSPKELESISRIDTNQTMLAVAKMKQNKGFDYNKPGLLLLLDGIQDPGNLGTIIRTADWFGVQNIVCSQNTVDFYNPKVITSTMGSFTRINIHYADLEKEIAVLKENNFSIYGAMLEGEPLQSVDLKKGALVIGSESNGITDAIRKLIDSPVKIEGKGNAESLNAAIATGIILYEFCK